jgi:hypothetical protein
MKTTTKRLLKTRVATESKLKIRAEMGPKLKTWVATGPTLGRASHYWSSGRAWWL